MICSRHENRSQNVQQKTAAYENGKENRLFFRAAPDPQLTLKIRQKVKRQEELLQTLQELAEDLQVLRG